MRWILATACLGVLVLSGSATAQQYPPPPLGGPPLPVLPTPPNPVVQPADPTPPSFGDVAASPRHGSTGTTGTSGTGGTPADPGTQVLGSVVTNPNNASDAARGGVLPRTGLDVAVLLAWALILMIVGRTIVKAVRDRQERRTRERAQQQLRREARREVPRVDTSGFVGLYSPPGPRSRAS